VARAALEVQDIGYWKPRVVYCQALQGEKEAAQLSLDLMSEVEKNLSPFMNSLIQVMLKGEGKVTGLPEAPSVEHQLLLLAAGRKEANAEKLAKQPDLHPALRLALFYSHSVKGPQEILLAERLAQDGMIALPQLVAAYERAKIPADLKKQNAEKLAKEKSDVARAALWQRIKAAASKEEKAALLTAAIRRYESDGLRLLALQLYARAFREMAPRVYSPEPYVPDLLMAAVDSLVLDSQLPVAQQWLTAARRLAVEEYKDVRLHIAQLVYGFAENAGSGSLEQMQIAKAFPVNNNISDAELKRLFRLYSLYSAFGREVEGVDWSYLMSRRLNYELQLPAPDLLEQMQSAVAANQKGEAVLLAITTLGGSPLSRTSDMVIVQVVRALKSVGLEKESAQLALEAALTTGQ
jgi:hypothetical protein